MILLIGCVAVAVTRGLFPHVFGCRLSIGPILSPDLAAAAIRAMDVRSTALGGVQAVSRKLLRRLVWRRWSLTSLSLA